MTPDLKAKVGLKDEKGAVVAGVISRGPADKAGIERGDAIVGFKGKEIKESHEWPYTLGSAIPSQ